MKLKLLISILIIFLCTMVNVWSIPGIKSIEKLRPKGSERSYVIYFKEQQAGLLNSKFNGKTEFEGKTCYRFTENFSLNLTPFDVSYSVSTSGRHYVDKNGYYIGDDMTLTVNERIQKLYLVNSNDGLTGYYERGGEKQDISRPALENFFAIDNNMVDQIESFLSFHNVYTGDTIYDSIFVPQSQVKTAVRVAVEDFKWVQYGKLYDSAYVCHFLEPTDQYVYYTKSRKVIRIDQESQDLQIILFESALDRTAPPVQSFTFGDFLWRMPIYLAYLIFGVVFLIPFLRKQYKNIEVYFIFVLGGVMFFIIEQTLFPLQKFYGEAYLIPGIEAGGSLYYYAIFTTLISGFFFETVKLIPILLIYFWKKPKQQLSIALGVFCGVGLGVVTACSYSGAPFQSGALKIVSLGVFEQIIAILFHAIAGAAFGYGINRGFKYLLVIWPIVVFIHSLSDYIVIFQQKGFFDLSVMTFVRTLICLIFLLAVFIMIKKARRS